MVGVIGGVTIPHRLGHQAKHLVAHDVVVDQFPVAEDHTVIAVRSPERGERIGDVPSGRGRLAG